MTDKELADIRMWAVEKVMSAHYDLSITKPSLFYQKVAELAYQVSWGFDVSVKGT